MRHGHRRMTWILTGLVAVASAAVVGLDAQGMWSGGFFSRTPPRFPTATTFDGAFHFCRIMFTSNRREKQGWRTDYPGADLNFSVRLAELTKVRVKFVAEGGEERAPDAVVVRLTDDALFQCPFTMMQDAGTAALTPVETQRLREYLVKGGFLLVTDYHGTWAREQFDAVIGQALPRAEYPIVDLTPPNHPLWNTLFQVPRLPQMASIQTWRRSGGSTLERWNEDGSGPTARGITDDRGRLMVLMVHNTDLPDAWEREGEDPEYFYSFSPEAYAVGINIVIYAMTH